VADPDLAEVRDGHVGRVRGRVEKLLISAGQAPITSVAREFHCIGFRLPSTNWSVIWS
jgi:hypothetical protein